DFLGHINIISTQFSTRYDIQYPARLIYIRVNAGRIIDPVNCLFYAGDIYPAYYPDLPLFTVVLPPSNRIAGSNLYSPYPPIVNYGNTDPVSAGDHGPPG
ncbi:hypothetical protein, partial [Methanoculleus sp. UBA334]|uniref:hypothetical protein n=1 Tax=Methanoculleus sp. UBA334 TaxID=1915503 RepID=UPI0031BB917A